MNHHQTNPTQPGNQTSWFTEQFHHLFAQILQEGGPWTPNAALDGWLNNRQPSLPRGWRFMLKRLVAQTGHNIPRARHYITEAWLERTGGNRSVRLHLDDVDRARDLFMERRAVESVMGNLLSMSWKGLVDLFWQAKRLELEDEDEDEEDDAAAGPDVGHHETAVQFIKNDVPSEEESEYED